MGRLLIVLVVGTATWAAFRYLGWGVATMEGIIAFWAGALMMVTKETLFAPADQK
jgi:hypothetical protein